MPTEEQLREIHRLAVLGEATKIAQDMGAWLSGHWLEVSRFREVRDLSLQTLTLGPHAVTLVMLGHAKHALGGVTEVLTYYQQALSIMQEVGDRSGIATTLNNIGVVYHDTGDVQQALTYYQQALSILKEVGDRSGESVTRYNIAMIYRAQGLLVEAVDALRHVVELDKLTQHPGLEADQAMLQQLEQEWRDTQS